MRLTITHEIVFETEEPAKSAIAAFRLFPRDFEGQHIDSWSVDFNRDCSFSILNDAFGNDRRTLYSQGPMQELSMISRGIVQTQDTAGIVRGAEERFPTEFWLRDSEATQPSPAIRAFALAAAGADSAPLDKPHRLMKALHETFRDGEHAAETAARAFEAGAGGPVERAHVMVAAARCLNVPARVVVGYLFEQNGEAKRRETAQVHVWTECFAPEIGWIGFDPTFRVCAHEGHVRLAAGLDYPSVEPIRAWFYGGAAKSSSRIVIEDISAGFSPEPQAPPFAPQSKNCQR